MNGSTNDLVSFEPEFQSPKRLPNGVHYCKMRQDDCGKPDHLTNEAFRMPEASLGIPEDVQRPQDAVLLVERHFGVLWFIV